jgi:hypothetical protein
VIGALVTVAKALAVCFAALHRRSVPPTFPPPSGGPVPRLRLAEERPVHTWPRTITKGQTATMFWCNANASEVLVEQAAVDGARRPLLFPIGRFPAKGSVRVSPALTTMYVISCVGAHTRCAESTTVTVRD